MADQRYPLTTRPPYEARLARSWRAVAGRGIAACGRTRSAPRLPFRRGSRSAAGPARGARARFRPAAQMLGLRPVTEAAEIDDPLDPLRVCHPRRTRWRRRARWRRSLSVRRGPSSGSGSTPSRCRVRSAQRFQAKHVTLVQLEPLALKRAGATRAAVAHQASYVPSRGREPGGEASADESGRAGNEHACAHGAVAPDVGVGASEAASRCALCSSKPPVSRAKMRPERSTISTAMVSVPASPRLSRTLSTLV